MNETAYQFWKRVDEKNPYSLIDLCRKAGIEYNRLKRNRSDCRLPSLEDAFALASSMSSGVEYLLTGREQADCFSPRIMTIARACEEASDLELEMVERILGISSKKGEDAENRAQ